MDNRGIEPVRSGTKKGRTNPGLAGVEKITSIWESTGWRITVERSRLMTITRHAAALLLYKVSCRFSGAGFQPENDSSRSSRMFVLELAHRRFPDHRRPPSSSTLQPPSRLFTQATGNISCHPTNPPARPMVAGWKSTLLGFVMRADGRAQGNHAWLRSTARLHRIHARPPAKRSTDQHQLSQWRSPTPMIMVTLHFHYPVSYNETPKNHWYGREGGREDGKKIIDENFGCGWKLSFIAIKPLVNRN